MKILSLFDGISTGRLALQKANVSVESYVAFEINSFAIEVSKKNWLDVEQYGDVTKNDFKDFVGYDLLIGGSPCQGLSSANVYLKDGEYGVEGTGKSRLFWEYVRAMKVVKPKFFLFENVASMAKKDREIITRELGVKPVKINSLLFSAQIRNRLYWTNIPFKEPIERIVNYKLKDILEEKVLDRYYLKQGTLDFITKPSNNYNNGKLEINPIYARPITASMWRNHKADADTYVSTEYKPNGRTNVRKITPVEAERLQNLPDNYTYLSNYSIPQNDKNRYECIGNGWTADVIAYIFSGLREEK